MIKTHREFSDLEEVYDFLRHLGANEYLILHLQLVGEAGNSLLNKIDELGINYDKHFVKLGIAFHDAGKIIYENEISNKGKKHENIGEKIIN